MSDPRPVSLTVEAVEARLVEIFQTLPAATGFGTAAPGDLTALVDSAVEAVESALPPFRCRSGCFECCEDATPTLTTLEWARMHAALASQPAEFINAMHEAVIEAYRGQTQIDGLTLAALRLRGETLTVPGVDAIDMGGCPMLVEGRCRVYEARPLMCRSYGYMTVEDAGETLPLMCQPAMDHITETFPADYALPRYEPFEARLRQLDHQVGVAHLPLWIMAQRELGGFLAPPITDPLPWAIARVTPPGFPLKKG